MFSLVLLLGILTNLCCAGTSGVTDEQYASMPTLFHIDDYDNCMMLKEKALFCSIIYKLEPLNEGNPSKIWDIIKNVSSSDLHYRHDILRHFICVPKSCPNVRTLNGTDPKLVEEINECYHAKYSGIGLKGVVEKVSCKTTQPVYQIDIFDYIVAIVFVLYLCFVTLISFYDLIKRYGSDEDYKKFKDSSCGKFIIPFSIPSNWSKLKSVPSGPDFEKFRCVQGIRIYTTFLVILVHTCASFVAVPVSNPKFFEELNDNPNLLGEFPKRGIFLLSFHFMMSTWLLINSLLAKTDRKEEIDNAFLIKSVIKRYVRFVPTVAVIVGFYATWFRHLPFGPLWEGICDETERCRKNWWANILFIQNYVDRYNMCHIISWYLGVEMQYFIISLILIKIMINNRNRIPYIIGGLLLLNMLGVFYDTYRHQYPSAISGKPEDIYSVIFNKKPQWHDHFASYHGNFAGSIVGLGFGYFYYQYRNIKIFEKKRHMVLWWIITFGFIWTLYFLPFIVNVDETPTVSALWVAFTRPVSAIGMGLLVVGLSQGLGGFIRWIFEWPPLYILARLSYCVYISHTVFQNIRVGLMRFPAHLNFYYFVIIFLSDIFIAFLAAVFLTLLFEMPSNELANLLFRTKKGVQKKKD